ACNAPRDVADGLVADLLHPVAELLVVRDFAFHHAVVAEAKEILPGVAARREADVEAHVRSEERRPQAKHPAAASVQAKSSLRRDIGAIGGPGLIGRRLEIPGPSHEHWAPAEAAADQLV